MMIRAETEPVVRIDDVRVPFLEIKIAPVDAEVVRALDQHVSFEFRPDNGPRVAAKQADLMREGDHRLVRGDAVGPVARLRVFALRHEGERLQPDHRFALLLPDLEVIEGCLVDRASLVRGRLGPGTLFEEEPGDLRRAVAGGENRGLLGLLVDAGTRRLGP